MGYANWEDEDMLTDVNVSGVESAMATATMFQRLAEMRDLSSADLLTLLVGEYTRTHIDEVVAWVLGEANR
jgi:hypothetical protein